MPQTWSAYADVVSADGARALIIRVSHDPEVDRAEIWVHAFIDGQLFGHMSAHPCPPIAAQTSGDERAQVCLDLAGRQMSARVLVSQSERSVFGEGSIPLTVNMQWAAAGQHGSNLRGRDERLVRVMAAVRLDGQATEVAGWGHLHTQLQEQPRFAVPFTYLSLRGDEIGFVGLLAGKLKRGFGTLRGERLSAMEFKLDPPAASRQLLIHTPSGDFEGDLACTYRYWIPMGGSWRDGSIVAGALGGLPVSGVINDYAGPAN